MRCPFAVWRGSPNVGGTPVRPAKGLVVHVEVGTEAGTNSCFQNPSFKASAHFGCAKDGSLDQWVDTDQVAWAEVAGNPGWISVETEGTPDEPLTQAQITSIARLLVWLQGLYKFPFQTCDHDGTGLTTHAHYPSGVADTSWGGHPCLPLDTTDVLTPKGWKKLADVEGSDLIASWSPLSGSISFAPPLGFVGPFESDVVFLPSRAHKGNPEGGWLETTPNHRVYVNKKVGEAYEVIEANEFGNQLRLPLAGALVNASGLAISDDLLRMLVWVQADGHYEYDYYKPHILRRLHFHFKKQRKIDRITELLDRLGIEYQLRPRTNGSQVIRIADLDWVRSAIMSWLPDKTFTWAFLQMTDSQFRVFADEIMLADGCVSRSLYRSTEEINLDVVQALYHLHSRRAVRDALGTGLIVDKDPRKRRHGPQHWEVPHLFAPYKSSPRYSRRTVVGCLSTKDETILIRQKGRVAIVGNCPGAIRSAQLPAILAAAKPSPTAVPSFLEELLEMAISDPGFAVRFLYRFCLHREADPNGYTAWVSAINKGASLDAVMATFQDSDEGKAAIVAERKALGLS